MNLSNFYWYFKSALPPKLCDDIIRYALSKKEVMARTGGFGNKLSKEDISKMQKRRKSDVVWLDELWIYRAVQPFIHEANKNAGWNFDWSRSEVCQFTKYKLNQYYDWHCDAWDAPYDRRDKKGNIPKNAYDHGMIRKLSVTCQLTDGSEYTGGELEFDFRNYDPPMRDEAKHLVKAKEILSKGSIIVFPSHIWHRVKPVTSGTRYSLVMWNCGYPFK